jgi:enediyne polyketide synthase
MMEIRRSGHSRVREPASRQRASGVDSAAETGGTAIDRQNSVAIVGLACRYPDADDIAAFFQVIVGRRRAFRRIPPGRLDLADHHSSDNGAPTSAYGTRAALIEGWRFDRAAFGISQASYLNADPARWLAMETTARALAAAGFSGGAGLPSERTGVYLGAGPLASARPGTIPAAICGQFGFGGGGFSIDAGAASSLAAVASACSALAAGELDAAVAGGVDVSLEPLKLAGLARAETLAIGDMRIYDQDPTGFLPGEGCGMVLLMRTADATAADLPVYAEILGYGMASAGQHRRGLADPASMLSALRRAHETARIEPADVQLIEGCGTGVGHADEAELTALATLRSAAGRSASIGAVTANIGNAGAAAGAAGLIKAVLAMANGVLPPTVGVTVPHQILSDADANLRVIAAPEPWPAGHRHAGVSACSLDGLSAHIVLGGQPSAHSAPSGRCAARPATARADAPQPSAFLVHAPDRAALTGVLARIADMARWLSDAQLRDLARQLAIEAADQGRVKVAIVASRQEQLARLASQSITMLPGLIGRQVSTRPGIFAADDAEGRVAVLLAGHDAEPAQDPQHQLERTLAVLHWLDELGVQPTAAVGHGLGELAALVCAGSISAAHARALNYLRTDALAASTTAAPGNLSSAIDGFAGFGFGTPLCRLVSGCTGDELSSPEEIGASLTAELLDARSAADHTMTAIPAGQRLAAAVRTGARGASLLLQSGRDRDLTRAVGRLHPTRPGVGQRRKVASVSVDGDPADDRCMARAAAALFAAGALTRASLLYSGSQARPIDIWREPVFISLPGQTPVATSGLPAALPDRQRAPRAAAKAHAASARRAPAEAKLPAPEPKEAEEPEVTGAGPWFRCYAEQTAEPVGSTAAPADGPWRIYTGGCDALRNEVVELFQHEPTAGRTLAVLGRPHDAGAVEAALLAAQDAIGTGQLLAVSPHPGWAGLWAALRAEHPSTGITTLRAELDQVGLRAAGGAGPAPGEYRELTIEPDGAVRELVMAPAATERCGDFPLSDGDVVLISRSVGAVGQALAQVLACCGAAVAVVGRDHPGRDDAVIAALEQLRQAGAAITYEIVNPASAVALDAAVRRIERRLGPVTAVVHAVRPTPPRAIASLRPADLRAHIASEATLLDRLVTAARGGGDALRFIVTFGSIAGRYGLGEAAMAALAAGMVADEGERLAAASPGCRPLHIDWPAAMPAADGSRLLLSVLGSAAELPSRLAVHGRLGLRAPRPVALASTVDPALTGRFTERVLVHYPGVELIAEATVDTTTDRYLSDYMVDGARLLPPTIAIEAMAQVASALTGAPMRSATDVAMAAPIVVSGPGTAAVIRLCALAAGDAVTVILRSDSTGFAVDHFRATFQRQAAAPRREKGPAAHATGTIKAGDLYGQVCSQAGRFKRLATVQFAGSKAATGVLDAAAEEPWFAMPAQRGGQGGRPPPLLGSPAMTDAALQLAQACLPHRRLLFARVASATFTGRDSAGVVQLHATQVSGQTTTTLVPRQRTVDQTGRDADDISGQPENAWDVDAIDSGGELVACFRGLVMRDIGPLPRTSPWPAPLAGCFIERAAAQLGLGSDLEVRLDRRPASLGQPNLDGWVRASASDVGPPGLVLRVRADGPVACGWRIAKQAGRRGGTAAVAERWLGVLDDQGARGTGTNGVISWATAMAIASCAGPAADPRDASVDVRQVAGKDWVLVRANSASMACGVIDLAGAAHPVAIAVMTGVVDRALAALGSS